MEIDSVKVPIFAYFGIPGLNENSSGDLLLNMSYRNKFLKKFKLSCLLSEKIHLKGAKKCMFKACSHH